LTAESASERTLVTSSTTVRSGINKTFLLDVHRPLYVIGSGDLGTNASGLDHELTRIFDVAHSWNAVVLIDEADVFLEERSVHDLYRNALVAVFLRQLEYFQGILFLTTNRVKTFDEAFESRIHVALRYRNLRAEARGKIWRAFFEKAGVCDVSEDDLEKLGERKINGRQIKNAVRTAQALAINRKQKLGYEHFTTVLDVMEQFQVDFKDEGSDCEGEEPKVKKAAMVQ
jgi:SpoVK/Ycf46/Vps4 family AAA+-type ATPase